MWRYYNSALSTAKCIRDMYIVCLSIYPDYTETTLYAYMYIVFFHDTYRCITRTSVYWLCMCHCGVSNITKHIYEHKLLNLTNNRLWLIWLFSYAACFPSRSNSYMYRFAILIGIAICINVDFGLHVHAYFYLESMIPLLKISWLTVMIKDDYQFSLCLM